MNISTNAIFRAIPIDCRTYLACFRYGMPKESSGLVWWPYSVTQTLLDLRLNELFRLFAKRGRDASETFGHLTRWLGFAFGWNGYGWCAQASNFSRGFARATSWANFPGECVSETPATRRSRPRADVSPIATWASRFPALIPRYPA